MTNPRRRFLVLAGRAATLAPLLLAGLGRAGAQAPAPAACYDPATLTLTQRNLRRANGYVEPAPDAAKTCGHCAFFSAGKPSCGSCQLMSGAPVSGSGVCASFAAKSG